MRVELVAVTPLRFADGSVVRGASGIARYGDGWLIVQDDATHGCLWQDGRAQSVRLVPSVEGHETFEEDSGTKALKPDLEAAVALPDGSVLALGSGSTEARMRSVLVDPDGQTIAVALTPVYARVTEALGISPHQLNLEGACLVGESLRWFQRGLPSAGVPTASVDVDLDALLAVMRGGDPDAVAVLGVHRYDLGEVTGVGLAVTDAVALTDGLVLVSAAAEDSPTTYDDGAVVGSGLALLEGDRVVDRVELPAVEGVVAKVEGLAVSGRRGDRLELIGVVDADDHAVPSLLLDLEVSYQYSPPSR